MGFKNRLNSAVETCLPARYKYAKKLRHQLKAINCNELNGVSLNRFFYKNLHKFRVYPSCGNKSNQIAKMISDIRIEPLQENNFFYSIDFFEMPALSYPIFDNYSVDYGCVVNGYLAEKTIKDSPNDDFVKNQNAIVSALKAYYGKLIDDPELVQKYSRGINAIGTLFSRPADSLFEGLQRILFINQFMWQTAHKGVGLGHLDWILGNLYENDLNQNKLDDKSAENLISQFFRALHANYQLKSTALLGDTGQIIVLGGKSKAGYYCNSLTYLFIKVASNLKLPDPKILLRCSSDMPTELLKVALNCIATGIGAPLLSNDDVVIPALTKCGYDDLDVYNYVTSACWEPLIPSESCDQNNVRGFNFADPFLEMLKSSSMMTCASIEAFIDCYECSLKKYIERVLTDLSKLEFEEDPLTTLLSRSCKRSSKDVTRGGAKYANIGLTSVGMGSVVNSILNIKSIVFDKKEMTLEEMSSILKNNYLNENEKREDLKSAYPCFGCDDAFATTLVKRIMKTTEVEFLKYHTKYGGKFKFGLSSPSYISDAKTTPATFDGRRNGDPFSTHISSDRPLPVTELLSFASKLDYSGLKCNGNVVDFIVNPELLKNNIDKYCLLVKSAFAQGVFQMQMNVVSSKTLIAAREHPEQFPNLIVRVWGFSAYFKDLPDEYKDVLIQRAIESEKAA